MIVDDEPNIRNGLPYVINWENFDFTISSVAKNGRDAVDKMKSDYPDLLITDINMPAMDGLGLLKYIREELNDKKMSFVILSGYDDFKYAREAIRYNVHNYLLKPIDEKELIKILSEVKIKLSGGKCDYFYSKYVEEYSHFFEELEEFDNLVNDIEYNRRENIEDSILKIFDYFEEKKLHPNIIKIHLDNFLLSVSKIVSLMGGDIDFVLHKSNILDLDISQINILKLKNILIEFSLNSDSYIAELKSNSGIINNIKEYVRKNYYKNIKLKDIANEFYINSAYLGRLFKKETGLAYSDYLNKIRLDNAKKLLQRTNLHIYQIADKVGYKNSDYFIIKFKERENCTPMEYKNKRSTSC